MAHKITSVLRYPGGKARVLNKILPFIPHDFQEFREPFVGGGSVFIRLKQDLSESISFSINDINSDLYLFWRCLQQDGNSFYEKVIEIKNEFSNGKELYKYYKSENANWNNLDRAVRFFILNRITFSGLIESGGYSQQSYDLRFRKAVIERLIPLSKLLEGVEITNDDYSYSLKRGGDNVFIFFDPPYFSSKRSKLYGKNGNLHTSFDHAEFAKKLKHCSHRWLITCDDSPEIRELFDYAEHQIPWNLAYPMTNVKKTNVKKTNVKRGCELIITNYDIPKELEFSD